ncbi:hypothetical protein GCM10010967_29070 [Dyadobacter beijingensis]|uniref:DUF6916 domain-containing protein n=1 Tax=Dyadobacter beijingensis TaxID=365489 RepID=A0ABQ2I0Z3_9BACT|nr:hypothetical protein [Dyadobacter beijingensis]GGM94081.1 hypothetical protein GCM10010967_29070 [Dyadobacter beijingensis]
METYDLSQITAAEFQSQAGEPVVIHFAPNFSLPAVIGTVTELNGYTPLERASFSVEFQTTGDHRVVAQGIYRVVRANGRYFDLFLVPVAQDPLGTRYEAVFS